MYIQFSGQKEDEFRILNTSFEKHTYIPQLIMKREFDRKRKFGTKQKIDTACKLSNW